MALTATLAFTPRRCAAQVDHAASRSIGDTTFLLPALQDSAFVLTEIGLRQGVEYESIRDFPIASLSRVNLSYLQIDEWLDVAIRVTDWFGVYGEGSASGSIGVNSPSLLFSGTGWAFGGKGGVVFRLVRSEATRSQLALRVYGGESGGRSLDLIDFFGALATRGLNSVEQIFANIHDLDQLPQALKNQLTRLADENYSNIVLVRESSKYAGASLHLAQGIVGPLTLQASVGVERDWGSDMPFDPTTNGYVTLTSRDISINFDGVASVDFSRWHVPIGISTEYSVTKAYGTLSNTSVYLPSVQYMGGGLFFTGRRGVQLGALMFTRRNLKPVAGFDTDAESEKPVDYTGQLVFRSLW
jgi:hypothetical protein